MTAVSSYEGRRIYCGRNSYFALNSINVNLVKDGIGNNINTLSSGNRKALAEIESLGKSVEEFYKKSKKSCEAMKLGTICIKSFQLLGMTNSYIKDGKLCISGM